METEPQENSDLLSAKKDCKRNQFTKIEGNGTLSLSNGESNVKGPPDGGVRAYAVVVGSFLINGLLFGVCNSYSVIYRELQHQLQVQGVANSESRASLVGALTMGTMFFLSPVSGILTSLFGIRVTAVLGGTIAALGLLLSSFVVEHVDALCVTYGVLYGLGASLAYTPSLAILGHYFRRYLGLVNGVVTIGSSVFTVMMPPIMDHMITNYGLHAMFRVLAVFTFGIALCGLLFKPTPLMIFQKPVREDGSLKSLLKSIVNVDIWKNKKYRLWALSMPVALFGYFVPYVHISKLIELHFKDVNFNLPLQCIAITSGIGRLVFGYLGDKPNINGILLQQISFYVIGALTIALPFVESFGLLVAISLAMGIFDGAFISLIGPIAFELCGGVCAAQAIGCMFGLAAVPLSVGPPIAGYLFGIYNSYTLPFVLAGVSPLVGATLMFAIRFHRRDSVRSSHTNGHVVKQLQGDDIEKNAVCLQEQSNV